MHRNLRSRGATSPRSSPPATSFTSGANVQELANIDVATTLRRFASLLEVSGEHPYHVRAHRRPQRRSPPRTTRSMTSIGEDD